MTGITSQNGSGDGFSGSGFSRPGAAELNVKSALINRIAETIRDRALVQQAAAKLCKIDQPTRSKVLRRRMENVTIDRLASWLTALAHSVEIHLRLYDRTTPAGHLVVTP